MLSKLFIVDSIIDGIVEVIVGDIDDGFEDGFNNNNECYSKHNIFILKEEGSSFLKVSFSNICIGG